MNNFNYLLLIIIIILLIFYLYINYNINLEFFQQLPQADLGPIKFVDYHTNEELGRYPSNWDESELYKRNTALQPTIIKIKRGIRGYKGKSGTTGSPGKCEGIININSIVGDNLEIASDNFRILSDNVKFKNKLCFGDDNKACLDKKLIDKINYNKIIENERDDYKKKVADQYYVLGTAKNLESTRADNAEVEATNYKNKFDTCDALRTNTEKYVTRDQCNKEVNDKDSEWSKIYQPIEKQNDERGVDILKLKKELKNEIGEKSATRTPRMYYTTPEYNLKVNELSKCTKNNQKLLESNNTYSAEWVKKGSAQYKDLSSSEKNKYGEKLDVNDKIITGNNNLYIKKGKCEWSIATDKNLYGKKVSDLITYDTSSFQDPRWGLITPSGTSLETLYGKIGNAGGKPELYMKKEDCHYDIANDKAKYGRIGTDDGKYGKIGTSSGKYGRIGTDDGKYGRIGTDDGKYGKIGDYGLIGTIAGKYGKIGSTGDYYGKIGSGDTNYIIRSSYNTKVNELNDCLNKQDMSNLRTINSTSSKNNLSIKGNNLEFDGNSVTFKNALCIQPDDRTTKVCLTKATIKSMNETPWGPVGPPGTCDATEAFSASSSSPSKLASPKLESRVSISTSASPKVKPGVSISTSERREKSKEATAAAKSAAKARAIATMLKNRNPRSYKTTSTHPRSAYRR
tara:strand:- start:1033 stop:3081 length:2049 start_codon:yes stop_codon:yes gene_type:complete